MLSTKALPTRFANLFVAKELPTPAWSPTRGQPPSLCVCVFGAWQRAAVMSVNLLHFLLHIIFKLSVASCKLIHFQATDLHAPSPIGIGIGIGVRVCCALYCFDFNRFGFGKQSHSLRNGRLTESLLTNSFPACFLGFNLFQNLLNRGCSSVSAYLRLYL